MVGAALVALTLLLPIHPVDDQYTLLGPPLEEHVAVSLPPGGRVVPVTEGRVWVGGRCHLTMFVYAEPKRFRVVDHPKYVKRFTLRDRDTTDHVAHFTLAAKRCAPGVAAAVLRSARLDLHRRSCDASGRPDAVDARVRAYHELKWQMVCSRASGRRFVLGRTAENDDCLPDSCSVGRPVVAGRLVAYSEDTWTRTGGSSSVILRDGLTGRTLRTVPAGADCPGNPDYTAGPVHSLVLRADGAFAWIVSHVFCDDEKTFEVHTLAGLQASGTGIDADSLRLRGGTISWRQDGELHYSRMDSPRIARAITSRWISDVPS